MCGQNGFLTAGLVALALHQLDRWPWLAGLGLGLLTMKPQLGLAFPLVLAAIGRWRAFVAAAICAIVLLGLSIALLGIQPWVALAGAAVTNKDQLLENSLVGFEKIMSVFAFLRRFELSVPLAYLGQALVTACVGAALVRLWRSSSAYELKAAACLSGTLLMTPFVLANDLLCLAPALAMIAVHARRTRWQIVDALAFVAVILGPCVAAIAPSVPDLWALPSAGLASIVVVFGCVFARAFGREADYSAAFLTAAGTSADSRRS